MKMYKNFFLKFVLEVKQKGFIAAVNHVQLKIDKCLDMLVKRFILAIFNRKNLQNVIIIESHNDFDCNGGAFYRYLVNNNINAKYKIIWLLKHRYRFKLPTNVYAFNIYKPSVKKAYFLSIAKYLLSDDVMTDKLKNEQISIYCTHGGCTFKNVKGLIVIPDNVDYILSSSERYDPYMCENYSIPYPNNRMLHLGFPSNDVFFENNNNEIFRICDKRFEKKILWMPTFRKNLSGREDSAINQKYGIPLIENKEQFLELNDLLKSKESVLIIKLHPMQDVSQVKKLKGLSNIYIVDEALTKKMNIDTYRLMADADALISDYSSAAYSFLMLNRPIGFVLSDLDSYKLGFSVENIDQFLVGEKIYSFHEFEDFIEDIIDGNDKYLGERIKLQKWMYEYCDGNACQRLADFLKL